jgi:hypothetical protein
VTTATVATTSEMDIFRRIVDPERPFLSPEAAAAILRLDFGPADRDRMNALAERNRRGALTPAEDAELASYLKVGQTLGILQSKARRSLPAGRRRTS